MKPLHCYNILSMDRFEFCGNVSLIFLNYVHEAIIVYLDLSSTESKNSSVSFTVRDP